MVLGRRQGLSINHFSSKAAIMAEAEDSEPVQVSAVRKHEGLNDKRWRGG